jgi:hypothetical protein
MFDRWRRPAPFVTEVIDQIPLSEVARVVEDYIDCDAEAVKAEKEADGTWTVTVTMRQE